jgi:hypothetical protein
MNPRLFVCIALCIISSRLSVAEDVLIDTFPYAEDFESVVPPLLPDGWKTSNFRSVEGDFVTEEFQGRNRLSTRNATLEQFVLTPEFDFTGYRPVSISFDERRSGTFGAILQVRSISDSADTLIIGETNLTVANTFLPVSFDLPPELLNKPRVRFSFHIIPDNEGTAGILRIDDVRIDAFPQHNHDIRVDAVRIYPALPTTKDSLHTTITIINAGLEPATGISVGIRREESSPLAEAFITETISPGDTADITFSIPPLYQGIYSFDVYAAYAINEGTDRSFLIHVHVTEPVAVFPWTEYFNYQSSELPLQWRSSMRNGIPDASLTTSIVHEGERAVILSNATREQFIVLPPFDISNGTLREVAFYERRTGSFDATLHVEISTDGGERFDEIGLFSHSGETNYIARRISIGETNPGSNFAFIRLRPAGDGTGGTGTIRFDSFSATMHYNHDLALIALGIDPPLPVTDDDVEVRVTLANRGRNPASEFSLIIEPDASKFIVREHISDSIEPGDSIMIPVKLPGFRQGIYTIHAYLEYSLNEGGDTSLSTDIQITDAVRSYPWSEIFDGTRDTLPMQWRTSYHEEIPDAAVTSSIVYQGNHALLMSDPSREQFIILPPFDVTAGIIREIEFYERRTGTFDATMHIDISGDRGRSFRRYEEFSHPGETAYVRRLIQPEESFSDNGIVYVRFRLAGNGTGTTGTIRFDSFRVAAQLHLDIAITGLEIDPPLPIPGETVRVNVTVRNLGIEPVHGFSATLYRLTDEMGEEYELIGIVDNAGRLDSSEMLNIEFDVDNLPAGYSRLRAEVSIPSDMDPGNNALEKEIFIRYPPRTLIINEIMYHTREGQPEFVEIFNPGEETVNLLRWSIRDRETPGGHINRYTLSDTSVFIGPGSFAVLSADSSIFDWFDLNGTETYIVSAGRVALGLSSLGDEVMLLDPSDSVIDSVAYNPSWHHPDVFETRGRSLERISPYIESQNPDNWSTSADPFGGTPGRHNSVFTGAPVTSARLEVYPNPFSPLSVGFDAHTIITYNLPQQTAMVRLRVFDSKGRQIRTLLNNQPSGPSGRVIWDGRNDHGRVARLGIYIILLEAYDGNRSGLTQIKSTVVLADRL